MPATQWVEASYKAGQLSEPDTVTKQVAQRITAAGGKVDYVQASPLPAATTSPHMAGCMLMRVKAAAQCVDASHLGAITDVNSQAVLVAVAAHFPAKDGTVRLIDNLVLGEPGL